MPATLKAPPVASQREELASIRGSQAKAALPPQVSASYLPELTEFAIKRAHHKMLSAAHELSLSESHLGRLVNDGDLKLKQLEALGPETLIALAGEILKVYAPLDTPKVRAMRLLCDVRRALDELQQLVEHVA